MIRPAGERAAVSEPAQASGSGVWQSVAVVLAKHFSPADAAKVQEQLYKVLFVSGECAFVYQYCIPYSHYACILGSRL